MSRAPNPEQKLAIEHSGGVLLKAGAGSGKTFVLVEHISHLTEKWIEDFKSKPVTSFEEYLRSKFSQVVMMTFTKKAAGEMSIRLNEKFQANLNFKIDNLPFWKTALELLPTLLVTTIDGFCRKLITLGFFPNLNPDVKIIFQRERSEQVKQIIDEWFAFQKDLNNLELLETISRAKSALMDSFTHVFNDPGLRLLWKKMDLSLIHPRSVGKLLTQSFNLNNLDHALLSIHALEIDEESERSAFEKMVARFQATGLPVIDSVDKFKIYVELFSSIKRLDGERTVAKKTPQSAAAKEGLGQLRKWINKWEEVVFDYEHDFEEKALPWMRICLEIFNYIDNKLDPSQGMTFGDIEYHVAKSLDNEHDRKRVQKVYHYFIVDEFQDTSDVQFKILDRLIESDFNKVFCVGDAKQAIYGFRGGELSVFQDCALHVPSVKTLMNNYRSLPEVINFNNSLFKLILPLGINFEGIDKFSVLPEDQQVPDNLIFKDDGEVVHFSADITKNPENESKYKNDEINKLEAIAIADAVSQGRASKNVTAILYSKLRPSVDLIRALMQKGIGFTAQYKIDLMGDPLLGIFVCLLKRQFDKNLNSVDNHPIFLIENYLKILNAPKKISSKDLIEFDQNIKFWGLLEAYRIFINKLHITNENSDINFEIIQVLTDLYHQDAESILTQLLNSENDRKSLEFRYGDDSHLVQIMSAHASKGLEFDVVFLAGIYTNGKEQNDSMLFGQLPGSFHWYKDISKKEKQKSPMLVLENELSGFKDFSESKRLFYVACTRAIKKLCWINFKMTEDCFSIPQNSWILALWTWMNSGDPSIKIKDAKLKNFQVDTILAEQTSSRLPLFFYDSFGVFPKRGDDYDLMILPELSVTRLNDLLDCPRKFYLGNVLKLKSKQEAFSYDYDDGEEIAEMIQSSSERGTYVHHLISKGIQNNFVVPREVFEGELDQPIRWALDQLRKKSSSYELISEKSVKFKFFNFMISGIPDLLLIPKGDDKAQIWDFKTGKTTAQNLTHYWLQLRVYAYSLYEMSVIAKSNPIELVLCFVDQEKNITKEVNYVQCRDDLYPIWEKQTRPWEINPDHCSQCQYGSICPR